MNMREIAGVGLSVSFLILGIRGNAPGEPCIAESANLIVLQNENICFEFDETDFTLLNIHDYSDSTVYTLEPSPIWRINLINTDAETLTVEQFMPVLSTECQGEKSYYFESNPDDSLLVLHLVWDKVPSLNNGIVEVDVALAAPATSRSDPAGSGTDNTVESFEDLHTSTRWEIRVTDYNDSLAVFSYDFPLLMIPSFSGFPKLGKLAIPHMSGSLIQNPVRLASVRVDYESDLDHLGQETAGKAPGMWGMQFSAMYERFPDTIQRGLFFALNDTTAWYKRFGFRGYLFQEDGPHGNPCGSRGSDDRVMEYLIRHYPLDNLVPGGVEGKISSMPYSFFIKPFVGDWYTASQIYRDWALDQPWTEQGPLNLREDFDHTLKDSPLILDINLFDYANLDEAFTALEKYVSYVGDDASLMCRVTSWYVGWPADPEPRLGVSDFISTIQDSLGFRVFPYVHSRGWGKSQPDDENSTREKCVAVNAGSVPFIDTKYSFYIMDPTCGPWQDKVADWAIITHDEIGASDVYVDNFQGFQACCRQDEHHVHSPGSGDFWLSGYKEIISRIRSAGKESDSCYSIVQEGKMENLIPLIDMNIILYFEDEEFEEFYSDKGVPIPLFVAVYHDYLTSVGSTRISWKKYFRQQNQFTFTQAFSFVNGTKLSLQEDLFLLRKDPDEMPDDIEVLDKAYWKLLGEYARVASDYLTYGKFMYPPELLCPEVDIEFFKTWRLASEPAPLSGGKCERDTDNQYDGFYKLTETAVQGGAFQAPDSTLGIFLTNFTSSAVACTLVIEFENYGLNETTYILEEISLKRPTFRYLDTMNGPEYILELTFDPKSVHAFRICRPRQYKLLKWPEG